MGPSANLIFGAVIDSSLSGQVSCFLYYSCAYCSGPFLFSDCIVCFIIEFWLADVVNGLRGYFLWRLTLKIEHICKFGPACKFDHPENWGKSLSSDGVGMPISEMEAGFS